MIVHINEQVSLADATVQEIQLELIRRHRYNLFDGQKVYDFLIKHRQMWKSVIMDRLGFVSHRDGAAMWGLVKLRDIPGNIWNVDNLLILTKDVDTANELARLFDEANLGGEQAEVESPENTAAALGSSPTQAGLISIWWD